MKRILTIALAAFAYIFAGAQTRFDGKVEIDHTVHDFGDVFLSAGPVKCTFTVSNIGNEPLTIFSANASCGCTNVEWTREEIPAGKTGTISATYSNDEGPYPFDKTLTVYFSAVRKPVVLHLRGVSREKERPLAESFPVKFGSFALRETDIKAGNVSQGEQKNGQVTVANVGREPLKLTFMDVSDGLTISVKPNPIPAGKTAVLSYNITTDRDHWGKCYYYATPVVNGRQYKSSGKPEVKEKAAGAEALRSTPDPTLAEGGSRIGFWSFTKENFSSWSKEEKKNGSSPAFDATSFSMGSVKPGKQVTATWKISNKGKDSFRIYKVDCDYAGLKVDECPQIEAGGNGTLSVTLDTTGLPKGETLILLNLTTNSPIRPLVTLYITGNIL